MHDVVAGWAIVISVLFGLGGMVFASWLASQRAEKSRVDALEREVAAINERDKHTPTAADMASLREIVGELRGLRSSFDGELRGLRVEIERVHRRFDRYEEGAVREASS